MFYCEGFTDRTIVLMETLEKEFQSVAKAYNTKLLPAKEWLKNYYGCDDSSLLKAMCTVPNYQTSQAPNKLNHRYLKEDVSCTLVPMHYLAKLAGIETPVADSVVTFAQEHSDIPILILSAKGQDNDKILGLNLGADDYIAKPFNALEVVARVRAQLRRAGRGNTVTLCGLTLDKDACTVSRDGEILPLTPMEYKLLAVLMGAPGRIFTKAQLFEAVSGEYYESDDNTIMVHISRLREKIEDDPRKPTKLLTVRGLGYKFESK